MFGKYRDYYIALICQHYGLYKTDKDIPKYLKMHIDHGLELINQELKLNPNLSGFDFIVEKYPSISLLQCGCKGIRRAVEGRSKMAAWYEISPFGFVESVCQ